MDLVVACPAQWDEIAHRVEETDILLSWYDVVNCCSILDATMALSIRIQS